MTTLDELSRQVAEKKGCWWKVAGFPCPARKRCPEYHHDAGRREGVLWPPHNYAQPRNLWELEGECQEAGVLLSYLDQVDDEYGDPLEASWIADYGPHFYFTEPATPEGRVRLVLRTWIEANS